jgi:hypothetical protein
MAPARANWLALAILLAVTAAAVTAERHLVSQQPIVCHTHMSVTHAGARLCDQWYSSSGQRAECSMQSSAVTACALAETQMVAGV